MTVTIVLRLITFAALILATVYDWKQIANYKKLAVFQQTTIENQALTIATQKKMIDALTGFRPRPN